LALSAASPRRVARSQPHARRILINYYIFIQETRGRRGWSGSQLTAVAMRRQVSPYARVRNISRSIRLCSSNRRIGSEKGGALLDP